ncbi:HDOD domain-containing protein [Thermocrinis sp.]|jgi:EAL and modified HD-GYP domain-containing signal transduction protein|uniref:EAL and HDOD domain-containing protein n=1 Tax=Thermocrinis sp. TaxID=2024383 RepID=UPI00263A25E7|nr:HDOD domain-containing protein [Thermocrinis sp.]
MSFLIAKQPIFDKEGRIVAYEVYLRKKGNLLEYPQEVPYNRSAYIIVEILAEYGIDRVGEGRRVMLNVSVDALLNKAFENLPMEKLIFELLKPQIQVGGVTIAQALKSMSRFKEAGALFASHYELLEDERYQQFVEESFLVSVDFPRLNDRRIEQLKAKGKKIIVTKIETKEQYEEALKVGDFFEGNYLESPYILKEFEIAPYLKTTLLRLMSVVYSAQSTKEIAEFISYDVGLTAKLLRFVNSAYFSPIQEIRSVEQACSMLGLKNLRNFIFLLAMNDYISVENPKLWKRSLVRALLAKSIAERIAPGLEDAAYLAGLFSLIDEILGVDKISFLRDIHLDKLIIDAYTGENERLKKILDIVSQLEERYSEMSALEDAYNDSLLINIEELTGIYRFDLSLMLKDAYEKANYIFNL